MLSAETRRSVRRSRKRDDAILFLLAQPRFTFQELQRHLGMEPSRVYGVLFGGTEEFTLDLALLPLGLVRQVRTYVGVEFEATEHGLRQARALARARLDERRL
jgi:predicted transcriptional regulator with HTH domain